MLKYLLPVVILLVLVVSLWRGLGLDPRHVPSPLVGKPLPAFSLPSLADPKTHLTPASLKGKPALLNVWATWCVGCRQEHDLLVEIARESGHPIYGVNYKDPFAAALDWLKRLGDPYVSSGYDAEGSVGLDLGVYGLPETFIVDASGTIVFKHVGPLTREIWESQMRPLLETLK